MSHELLLTLTDDHSLPAAPATDTEAHAHAARGDWAGAERLFEEARAAASRAGDDVALAVALTNRGQSLARLGRLEEAALILDAALETRRRLHAAGAAGEAVVARGLADVAAVAAALGDPTEAARLLRRARAHAVASEDHALLAAIDERLAGARALGAADDDAVAVALVPEPLDLAAPAEPLTGLGELSLETFGADEPDADEGIGGPALTFLDAEPLADGATAVEPEPLVGAAPSMELESLVDGGPVLGADYGAVLVLDPVPVLDEEPVLAATSLEAEGLLIGMEPVLDAGEPLDLGGALPAGVALLVDAAEPDALATPLDAGVPDDESPADPMPVDATVPLDWLAPPASELDAELDGAAEDAWSQVDPAPFDSLDADDVHSRAVAMDTSPRGYAAITVAPDDLASADALLALDDDADAMAEAMGEVAPTVASPTGGASLPRRRTTGSTPTIAPPDAKRPWWRRLTGRRG